MGQARNEDAELKPQPNLHACTGATENPLNSYVGADELDKVLTYASEAIGAGVTDWHDLTRGVPANWLPRILGEWVDWCLDRDQLPQALTEAWASCEAAEQALSREQWIRCFRAMRSRSLN